MKQKLLAGRMRWKHWSSVSCWSCINTLVFVCVLICTQSTVQPLIGSSSPFTSCAPPHVYTHPRSSWVHSQAAFRMASANACSIKSCSGFGESRPAWGFNGRRTSLKDQHAALWYTTERRWKEGQQTHTRSYQRTKTGSSDGLGAEGGLLLSHRCVFVVTASSMTCWQWLSGSGSQTSHVCSFSWSLKCMLTLLMCSWHFSEQTWTKTMQCDCHRIILTVNGWICDDIELSDIY